VRATVAWGRIVLQGSSAPCSCARPRAPGGYCTTEIVVHKHALEQFGRRALLKNVDRCGKEQHRPLKVQVRHLRPAQEGPHLPGCRRRNVRDPAPSREPMRPRACCHAAALAGRWLDVVAAAACSMYVISCAAWGSISTPPRSQSAGRPVRSRDVDGGADRWLCWVCRASQGDEDVSHERCVPGHPLPAGASSSGDANTARVFSREI